MDISSSKQRLGADFLALLDNPGPTSDLTLIAAGGRSFPVHRVILAARCEFFKTMFVSDVGDAAFARELPLPDADPDALALLLRYIYGGVLDECERDLLKPAVELADFLRLVDACGELQRRLLGTATQDTIAEDMLWAEGHGDHITLLALVFKCVHDFAAKGADAIADVLSERSPKLLARLYKQLAAKVAAQEAAKESAKVASGTGGFVFGAAPAFATTFGAPFG